ncbi:MAG: hypothetical protein PR2021_7010 [Candidatus Phytoplasma pruni]|nr:MAG: hypothetical protein PR2021_7010 [Candidatus Phytoplasma pruni]
MEEYLVQIKNLQKKYNNKYILRDINYKYQR